MRKKKDVQTPLYINDERVGRVGNFKFLGTHIAEDLSWTVNTNMLVKRAQKWLYFVKTLRKTNLSQQLLVSYYI